MGPIELANYVQQQGDLGRQRGTQNRLAQLASQAYAAPAEQQRGFVQQAIQTDPTAGFALGQSLGQDRNSRIQSMSQKARMLVGYAKAGNRQGVDSLYPQIAQEAAAVGLGQNIPPAWDDSYLPGMEQLANIAVDPSSAPAGLREFQAMSQGLSAEDQTKARRIALGLEGRASNAGYSQVKFTGADGRERIGVLNGKTGQIDLPDGTSFNPQTGQIALTQPMGAPAGSVIAESGQAMPVTQFTGADGQPVNIGNDIPPHLRQQILGQSQQFAAAPDGATATLPNVNVAPAQFRGGASPFVGRRAEDEAAAVEAAKQRTQIGFLPERQRIENDGAIARARGEALAKLEAEMQGVQAKKQLSADDALGMLDAAEELLQTATSGRAGAAVDAVAGFFGESTEGSKATASLKTLSGQLVAKMPRMEGPQSDRDVQMYKDMAGDLANPNLPRDDRLAALQMIRTLNRKYASAPGGLPPMLDYTGGGNAPAAPQGPSVDQRRQALLDKY